jgi:ectoine hydroxylase-related dioxygenase (phytanoyl-CoA dioxygenase family)
MQVSSLVEVLDRSGYAVVPRVIDDQLVAEARHHVRWLRQKHPDLRGEQLGHELVADDPFWLNLVGDDRILDLVEEIIGPDIALFASAYIAKPPHHGLPVLWHQDGAYWPLEPMDVVTIWLALDDSEPGNGCIRVIPGSHRSELLPKRERDDIANVLASEIDVRPQLLDEKAAVDLIIPAGGASIHHPAIIHSSHANTSDRWRHALTIRYIPTTTRIVGTSAERPWPCAFVLRGAARPGINVYQSRPAYVPGHHYPFHGSEQQTSFPVSGKSGNSTSRRKRRIGRFRPAG